MSRRWDAEDWQAYFDERAGILEYNEGLSRQRAEMIARAEIIQMKRLIPIPHPEESIDAKAD